MPCIYKITNCVNGKCYIGQTKQSLKTRWSQHKRSAKLGVTTLYCAIQKYGIENFYIECLQEYTIEELDTLEIYWIAKFNSYKDGYNATPGGKYMPDKVKFRKRVYNPDLEKYNKKVKQYTLSGDFIKEYFSIRKAADETSICRKCISECCNNKAETAGGFLWCFTGEESRITPLQFNVKLPNRSKTVIAVNEKGDILTFPNCNEAAKSIGGEWDAIRRRCNGIIKNNFYKGYYWKYKEQ